MVLRRKPKLYLDTSVLSAYFDDRAPERRSITILFFERLADFEPRISEVVLAEIAAMEDEDIASRMLVLAGPMDSLPLTG